MIIRLACLLLALSLPLYCPAQDAGEIDVLAEVDAVFSDPSDFTADTDNEFELDEILAIDMSAEALALARSLGFTLLDSTPLPALGFTVNRLRLPISFNVAPLLDLLTKADPLGLYGKNPVYRLAGESPSASACEGLRCYGQQLIGWPAAGCPISTRIGMLDSAVDRQHPALKGSSLSTARFSKKPPSRAEREHGTAVAAQLVGQLASGHAGLLPQASLFAADVFEQDADARPYTDAFKLVQGLNWLAQQRIDTLNISIGGPDNPVLHKAVQTLVRKGVAISAAAGNLGAKAAPQYPAAYAEVLAVTAVDRQLRIYAGASQGAHVRIAAPGVAIWTTGDEARGQFHDGTSFAAPFATAALALLHQQQTQLSPAQRVAALTAASRDLGAKGRDPVYGTGLLQLPGRCLP
ncbi:MAG: S8 family serine peptidase [Pseudomonadota bacterium]